MKKICFFSGDITRSGGTERVAIMIANELHKERQYEVCFLSLCEQRESTFFSVEDEIVRHKLGQKWIQPGPGYLPLIGKLRRFIKEQDIDIIIDIDIVLDCLSIPASWGLKTKLISWEHFNCLYEMSILYRKLILKFSVKHSDYVVTLTERDKKDYAALVKRNHNIEAIYNPMKEISRWDEANKQNHIISVGRLVPDKGMKHLAEVALRVLKKHDDWQWYVLGEGEERAYLEAFISEHKLENRFILTGLVSDVGEYLAKSKIFVLTSVTEGLGMCLLEAKEYDLPCISFDVPTGPGEVIEDKKNGYLIEPFDYEAMSEKINELIENEEILSELSRNAKSNIEKFQMESIMKKWNRVLNSLCE